MTNAREEQMLLSDAFLDKIAELSLGELNSLRGEGHAVLENRSDFLLRIISRERSASPRNMCEGE